jgi:hypothetical protein
MPWFVCFAIPPRTALNFHRDRVGMSALDDLTREEAIDSIRRALEAKGHEHLTLVEAYQYTENEES